MPSADSIFFFIPVNREPRIALVASGILSSIAFDSVVRQRLGGLNMSEFVMVETPLPRLDPSISSLVCEALLGLSLCNNLFAREWLLLSSENLHRRPWRAQWAVSEGRRLEKQVSIDAICAGWYGLSIADLRYVLSDCDLPRGFSLAKLNPKGFWRVDKDKEPELRHTVLTLIAFHDLEQKIRENGGDRVAGIEAFLSQNNGEGWLLPETVRLADYGLGHDERALEHQPVASRLGPRFYDWQLSQSAEESWRECHLHARNLLGEKGYKNLLAEIEAERSGHAVAAPPPSVAEIPVSDDQQMQLFS